MVVKYNIGNIARIVNSEQPKLAAAAGSSPTSNPVSSPPPSASRVSTPYHAAFWARALTCKGPSDAVESLTRSMAGARVELNPHQVDAALFAVRSPLSKGVILADEVGLGKTIEAGLIIAQRWAERKRQILLVVPATLRKQWQQELSDKFALTATILDGARYNAEKKAGRANPFDRHGELVACSYQFAAAHENDIRAVDWDLVAFDEAHRLRNVYRTDSHIAAALQEATNGRQKMLLTATPLHNNLLELYGLVSFVDLHVFGDLEAFRKRRDLFTAQDEIERKRDATISGLERQLERRHTWSPVFAVRWRLG